MSIANRLHHRRHQQQQHHHRRQPPHESPPAYAARPPSPPPYVQRLHSLPPSIVFSHPGLPDAAFTTTAAAASPLYAQAPSAVADHTPHRPRQQRPLPPTNLPSASHMPAPGVTFNAGETPVTNVPRESRSSAAVPPDLPPPPSDQTGSAQSWHQQQDLNRPKNNEEHGNTHSSRSAAVPTSHNHAMGDRTIVSSKASCMRKRHHHQRGVNVGILHLTPTTLYFTAHYIQVAPNDAHVTLPLLSITMVRQVSYRRVLPFALHIRCRGSPDYLFAFACARDQLTFRHHLELAIHDANQFASIIINTNTTNSSTNSSVLDDQLVQSDNTLTDAQFASDSDIINSGVTKLNGSQPAAEDPNHLHRDDDDTDDGIDTLVASEDYHLKKLGVDLKPDHRLNPQNPGLVQGHGDDDDDDDYDGVYDEDEMTLSTMQKLTNFKFRTASRRHSVGNKKECLADIDAAEGLGSGSMNYNGWASGKKTASSSMDLRGSFHRQRLRVMTKMRRPPYSGDATAAAQVQNGYDDGKDRATRRSSLDTAAAAAAAASSSLSGPRVLLNVKSRRPSSPSPSRMPQPSSSSKTNSLRHSIANKVYRISKSGHDSDPDDDRGRYSRSRIRRRHLAYGGGGDFGDDYGYGDEGVRDAAFVSSNVYNGSTTNGGITKMPIKPIIRAPGADSKSGRPSSGKSKKRVTLQSPLSRSVSHPGDTSSSSLSVAALNGSDGDGDVPPRDVEIDVNDEMRRRQRQEARELARARADAEAEAKARAETEAEVDAHVQAHMQAQANTLAQAREVTVHAQQQQQQLQQQQQQQQGRSQSTPGGVVVESFAQSRRLQDMEASTRMPDSSPSMGMPVVSVSAAKASMTEATTTAAAATADVIKSVAKAARKLQYGALGEDDAMVLLVSSAMLLFVVFFVFMAVNQLRVRLTVLDKELSNIM